MNDRYIDIESPVNWNSNLNRNLVIWYYNLKNNKLRTGTNLWHNLAKNNHGVFNQGPFWTGNRSRLDGKPVISMDGTNDYIQSQVGVITSKVTIGLWINVRAWVSVGFIAGCLDGIGSIVTDKIIHCNGSGQVAFYTYDGATRYTSASAPQPLNTWIHVVGTNDGATSKIFVNGIEAGSTGSIGSATAAAGYVNSYVFVNGITGTGVFNAYMNMYVDDFRFYLERGLTNAEVYQWYIASKNGYRNELNWISRRKYFLPVVSPNVENRRNRPIFTSFIKKQMKTTNEFIQ